MKYRIAFITIQKQAYSETFIAAQREQLTGDLFFLWNMGLNSEDGSLSNREFESPIAALKNYLLEKEIDVVFAQFGITGANVFGVCKELKIPLVVHFHGFDAYRTNIITTYKDKYVEMFDYASFIIGVSRDMIKQLSFLGARKDKLIYAPCGVNNIFFDANLPLLESKTFVSVGRFVSKKAPHLTLAAFKQVLGVVPDSKLIMIGGGDSLHEACIDLAHAWGISNHVEFLGILSPVQIIEVFSKCFCFVQHSVTSILDGDAEGSPVAIMEASANGLPVISTRHKGINEIVLSGKTGYLVDERNIDQMAKRMINLLMNPTKAAQMGIEGRKHISKHYLMRKYINNLDKILRRAVNEK